MITKNHFHCPACYSYRIADKWLDCQISDGKKILWCADCGFGWQHPLPTPKEIRDYYDSYSVYNIHGSNEKERGFFKRINRLDKLHPNRGRLLDIGSGLGHFLKIAKEDGWDVTGIEPQASAASYCQNKLGIRVHSGPQELDPDESFNVITLWDVWEHVHNPLPFLDQCIKLVAPGGLLVMAIPNASGWPAQIFKGKWRYVMGTHLNYYTLPYVKRIIDERSMSIERIDHTIKIQSLLQGITSWLPYQINTERMIRLGRKDSIEKGRPEQTGAKNRFGQFPMIKKILALTRLVVHKINLMSLPLPYGDLMDIYCRRKRISG